MRSTLFVVLCAALLASMCGCITDSGSGLDTDALEARGDTVRVDGGMVLTLRGTHEERGYQHGYLLGNGAKAVFDSMFVGGLFESDSLDYESARASIMSSFVIDERFRTEAGAMIRGMYGADVPMENAVLGRAIDSVDILVMNCLEELYTVADLPYGCSSLSSWGNATAEDNLLAGELVITRHWDYAVYPSMAENLTLIVHLPAELGEQPWICAGWAGVIGSCSGMNAGRVGAFLNYGIVDSLENPGPYRPVSFSLRRGIEDEDYNGDGGNSTADVIAAFQTYPSYFPAIIHAVAPVSTDSHAIVIEVNNHRGLHLRDASDNIKLPATHLAAVNTFRELYPSNNCDVYNRLVDSLKHAPVVDLERNAQVLAGAGGWSGTIYRVQYSPGRGLLHWSCRQDSVPAHLRPFNLFRIENLLG